MLESYRHGMRGFILIWFGQLVSLLGTNMTLFGLTVWTFTRTGRATDLALILTFYGIAMLLMNPLAGVIVDRYPRQWVMIGSDLGSGLVTIVFLPLLLAGQLEVWHLYIAAVIQGAFQSVQWPAYSATITLMLRQKHYTRANSLSSLSEPSSQIIAPLLAGALLGFTGLAGILIVDIATFLFAIGTQLFVHIPDPDPDDDGPANLWAEMLFGFRYIWERRPLLAVQLVFMGGNFIINLAMTLLAPLILTRTGNNELLYGTVQTIGAVGGVLGALAFSLWGGFARRIWGVLLGWGILLGTLIIVGLGRGGSTWEALLIWGGGLFVGSLAVPMLNSSNQAIWQSKVEPALQGRVFSIRSLIAGGIAPLAAAIAGPLADHVMEPAMQPGGALSTAFGGLVGTGPGAGMALIILSMGLLGVLFVAGAAVVPAVRHVERLLPDHGQAPAAVPGDD